MTDLERGMELLRGLSRDDPNTEIEADEIHRLLQVHLKEDEEREAQRDTLLAALRGCLEWFEANPVNETGQYHERQARAAIAEVKS